LHWGNNQYDIARSPFTVGSELILVATLGVAMEDKWEGCAWWTPQGEVWAVTDEGQVVDQDDSVVEGVESVNMGPKSCGIRLVPESELYAGQWLCIHSASDVLVVLSLETEDEVSEGLRLPELFQPLHYDLYLEPDLSQSQTSTMSGSTFSSSSSYHYFSGRVTMHLQALVTQDSLVFHSDELDLMLLVVRGDSGEFMKVKQIWADFQRTTVTLILDPSSFIAGSTYSLEVEFVGDLERGNFYNYGFYHQACSNSGDKQCWFTQGEATNIRNAFPCLDEPGLKATFDVAVGRTSDYSSLSNMPLIETQDTGTGKLVDVFDTSPIMSPYLVCVAVTDYKPVRSETDNTTVWAPAANIEAGEGDYSALVGPEVLRFYGDLYQVEYMLPKMDLVYEAHKGSAMENWGLILFDPRALMLDPSNTDPDVEFLVLSVVAHEISHQWFGNLVTMNWWDQTWLNEGFAVFVSYQATHHVNPELDSWARLYVGETQRVMLQDQNTKTHWAMSDSVSTRDDIERKFGSFTYQKGGSVIRMMEGILGEKAFIHGVVNYLSDFSYSSTVEEDLFGQLEAAGLLFGTWPQPSGPNGRFGETMKTWTDQPGLPVVTAGKECNADQTCSLSFSQEWLTNTPQSEGQLWDIPLTFSTVGEEPSPGWEVGLPQQWLTVDQPLARGVHLENLEPDTPFVVNIQGVGYYRVNYPESNWRALAEVLRTNRDWIHPMNRAQIICDAAQLAEVGLVTSEVKEDILSYIELEEAYAPIAAFKRCVSNFKEETVKSVLKKI